VETERHDAVLAHHLNELCAAGFLKRQGPIMFLSLSLPKKLPTQGGEGERAQRASCAGTDRAKRAPYPRFLEVSGMTDVALLELLKWIVIASASGARQQRVLLRRRGRLLEPQRGRGRGEK
jgi:hypothetical protein